MEGDNVLNLYVKVGIAPMVNLIWPRMATDMRALQMNLNLGDTQLIIREAANRGLLRNQLAYVLATAYHETAHTMKPVREMGGEAYLKKKKYYPYVGMGYVQLTWDYNYKKAGDKLGVDFLKNPKLLLEPKYAAPILVIGMQEGWFTGKRLDDYITLQRSDFKNARRIVNGMDKADLIAGYAEKYDKMLLAAGYGVDTTPPIKVKPNEHPPVAGLIGVGVAALLATWTLISAIPCKYLGILCGG